MTTHEADIVVVGAGTAGCYAAATAAREGFDVTIVERKPAEEAGHIACGDALKGSEKFPEAISKSRLDPAMTNTDVDHGRFEIPQEDTVLEIPVDGGLAVIDRFEYGRQIIAGAEAAGVDFHYDTVVRDVTQNGQVNGVRAVRKGTPVEYDAGVVLDAAGALSVLQDKVDFSESTFDTNVTYSQFCSAYREIVHVDEPVEWSDALVFKPTDRAAGYLWYFPRTETEINAGLGFQMTEEPMQLVDDLKRDLRDRREFQDATVEDKLGAALPTRRPYDSAVAPGYLAVGDAAGHVNPTTGGGIAGAAFAGQYAAEAAMTAIENGTTDEEAALWEYNERVMDDFGARYAALDAYNVLTTAIDVDDLMGLLAAIPADTIAESLDEGTSRLGLFSKLKIALGAFGHWDTIYTFYKTKLRADDILDHYESYPDTPAAFDDWQRERDRLMNQLYETTGADPKY
jgi:geranylgeranyl reductase family protein